MKEDFKILLLFPPVWVPEIPYLSLPTLTSWLQQKGYNIIQRDLNIEFWHHFHKEKKFVEMCDKALQRYEELSLMKELSYEQKDMYQKLKQFAKQINDGEIESSTFYYICTHFGGFSYVEQVHKKPSPYPWETPQKYHDRFFEEFSYSSYGMSTEDILMIVNNGRLNSYISYYEENVVNSIIEIHPDLIGISIVVLNQVIPAFTLARVLKKHLPDTHINIGGSWCSYLYDILPKKQELFDIIDSAIVFEGEKALEKLALCLKEHTDFQRIPNLIYKRNGSIIATDIRNDTDLNELPPPVFDNLPLHEYWNPGVLSLQTSRGCYWAKCAFCSYSILEPLYKQRDVGLVISDIKCLIEKYNAKQICFADACIPPIRLKKISECLIKNGIKIPWMCFGRFDKGLTLDILRLIRKSGCWRIVWGLESGCDKILIYLNKGTKLDRIRRILHYSALVGIDNRVCLMYGLPPETIENAMESVRFCRENKTYINSLAYTYYTPERQTKIVKESRKYSLQLTNNPQEDLAIGYKHKPLMSNQELRKIQQELERLDLEIENVI